MAISKKIIHQTVACSPIILNQFMVGVGWGWTAPTLTKLNGTDTAFSLTVEQASWLASINEVGRLLGPFVSPLLVDNIGRRLTLALISVLYFTVWSTTIFAYNIYALYTARLVFGLANGIHDVVAAIYTTENCSTNFRGIISSIVTLTHYGAIFAEFVVASYLSYTGTAVVNTAMAACVFVSLYFGTETPYFLIMKGKREKAERNLVWLSGNVGPHKVAEELRQIERSVSEEKQKAKSFKLLFSSPANVTGILIVLGIHVLQMATGASSSVTYASVIFSSSETFTESQYTILFGVTQFIAVAISPFIIEKVDRRTLLIGSFGGMGFSNLCACVLILARNHGYTIIGYPWLIFVSMCLYGTFCALMTPVMYALKGELLPLSVRAIGSSIAVTGHSITSFLVTKMFFPVTERYGMQMNFVIYCILSLLATAVFYYVLPETRGKSLHELQNSKKGECVELEEVSGGKVESKYIFAPRG